MHPRRAEPLHESKIAPLGSSAAKSGTVRDEGSGGDALPREEPRSLSGTYFKPRPRSPIVDEVHDGTRELRRITRRHEGHMLTVTQRLDPFLRPPKHHRHTVLECCRKRTPAKTIAAIREDAEVGAREDGRCLFVGHVAGPLDDVAEVKPRHERAIPAEGAFRIPLRPPSRAEQCKAHVMPLPNQRQRL